MHSNVLPEDAFTILMDGDIDGNEIRMRVEAAKYLIDEGNYDMMEVARQCGYENEVTFRRAFMKQFK